LVVLIFINVDNFSSHKYDVEIRDNIISILTNIYIYLSTFKLHELKHIYDLIKHLILFIILRINEEK